MITEWRFSAVRYAVLIHKIFNSLSTKGTSLPYKMAFCKNSLRHQTESSLVEGNFQQDPKKCQKYAYKQNFCMFLCNTTVGPIHFSISFYVQKSSMALFIGRLVALVDFI